LNYLLGWKGRKEGGKEGGREGKREGEREEEREGGREGRKEGKKDKLQFLFCHFLVKHPLVSFCTSVTLEA
jgi:hypothetical protein